MLTSGAVLLSVVMATLAEEVIMENENQNQGIAITATTEQDLLKLGPAFRGEFDELSPRDASDDFLVAALLGWHMRNTSRHTSLADGYVFTEFALRRTIASGETFTEKNSDLRAKAVGKASESGHILTVGGIGPQTPTQIEARVESLLSRFQQLQTDSGEDMNAETDSAIRTLVASFSDQEIIDIGTWSMLQTCPKSEINLEPPNVYSDELMSRAVS